MQVSLAALGATRAAIANAPRAVESHLEKLAPLLFLKLHALKEAQRAAADAALTGEWGAMGSRGVGGRACFSTAYTEGVFSARRPEDQTGF